MIVLGLQAYISFALIVFALVPLGRLSMAGRAMVFLIVLALGIVPLPGGLSLAGYLRGFTDDLAITTLVWLAAAAIARLGYLPAWPLATRRQLWIGFALAALVLYPAALGIGMIDTYRWGFVPRGLIVAAGLLTLLLVLLRNGLGVSMLIAATAAFILDLKPSDNFWDYLLDPILAIYAIVALARDLIIRLRRRRSNGSAMVARN
ncbi:MAG TPA: hypothetical protein ENI17_08295 [Pseudomonas xinjiangensis]|uniref:Uncharacterized protein n=2 Tax=root TaxID=1 RepID=A0A7V1FS57_9GAMM|nr:hypothetical protein [Halopseudomonas xinjiangensis]HEC47614.1 hypothetical protein [Halopseudomonas xinjiangensis]